MEYKTEVIEHDSNILFCFSTVCDEPKTQGFALTTLVHSFRGPAFGGQAHVMKVLYGLGCFEHQETCPKCGNECSFQTNVRKKMLKDGCEKQYSEESLKCDSRKCLACAHFIDNTIRSMIKDRFLFVFVVNAFLNRASTQSVVNDTGC